MVNRLFKNRQDAGAKLGALLSAYLKRSLLVVLGIPRGGVPVAKVISDYLEVPLGVLVSRKIGAPNQTELAIGAVAPEGQVTLDHELIKSLGVGKEELARQIENTKLKVREYSKKFEKRKISFAGKVVILVDDGVATGATIKAAANYLRKKGVSKIILAAPVVSKDTLGELRHLFDESVVLATPEDFGSVGEFYEEFPQVTDKEVEEILRGTMAPAT